MTGVEEARHEVMRRAVRTATETLNLIRANRRVLAEDVRSPVDHPLFDQSAVDGYALRLSDLAGEEPLPVAGEIRAGDGPARLPEGTAMRIYTGGIVPPGATAVIMQENVRTETGGRILAVGGTWKEGVNIRRKGEQVSAGATALERGSRLNPASLGLLASLGVASVKVSRLPGVSITVTGSEFVPAGGNRKPGQIYSSNGIMLQAALADLGIGAMAVQCGDDASALAETLDRQCSRSDVLMVTGGISVGRYDFTKEALEIIGFTTVFHKVSQKPGKPLLFARKDGKVAFGLPGNPRAALVCFYEYVVPYIMAAMGASRPYRPELAMPLGHDLRTGDDRTRFLAAIYRDGSVHVLPEQDSHMLKSLSLADVMIEVRGSGSTAARGSLVRTKFLPT